MGLRRNSREAALQYLYQTDSNVESETLDVQKFIRHFGVDEFAISFFRELIAGVESRKEEIDSLLEKTAEHWKLYRMGRIDRSVLRMACFELLACRKTDYQVVIDEAVELAKIYGSTDSASFVNGILDRLAHQIREMSLPIQEVG